LIFFAKEIAYKNFQQDVDADNLLLALIKKDNITKKILKNNNVNIKELEKKIGNIKNIVLFCALGLRSALATKALKEMGFDNVANAEGGFDSLKKAGFKVIHKEKK